MEATKQAEFIFSDEPNVGSSQPSQPAPTTQQQFTQIQQALTTQTKVLERHIEVTHQSQQQTQNAITQVEQKVQHNLNSLLYQVNDFNDAVLTSMVGIVVISICTTVLMTSYWQRVISKRVTQTIEKAIASTLNNKLASEPIDTTSAEVVQIMRTMQSAEKTQQTTVDT